MSESGTSVPIPDSFLSIASEHIDRAVTDLGKQSEALAKAHEALGANDRQAAASYLRLASEWARYAADEFVIAATLIGR